MAFVRIAFLLLAAFPKAKCGDCNDRVAALEAQFAEFKKMFTAMERELQSLRPQVQKSSSTINGTSPRSARRLSGVKRAAVPAWQIHEFPNDASCFSGESTRLLPKENGALSWTQTPNNPEEQLTLLTVGANWQTTEVQDVPSPLKVVHDSACSSATLDVGMDTNIDGSLTVDGQTVATRTPENGGITTLTSALTGTFTTDGSMTDFPGLTKTITLTSARPVLIYYSIYYSETTGTPDWNLFHTQLMIDGAAIPEARSINGVPWNSAGVKPPFYATNTGLYIWDGSPGTFTFSVQYRTFGSIQFDGSNVGGESGASLQVLLL